MVRTRRNNTSNRQIINQMNVVPYIDVMLVLLIIFMVTAPMFVPGVINLPSVGKSAQVTTSPIQIMIDNSNHYSIAQKDQPSHNVADIDSLITQIRGIADDNTPIVIAADKEIKYNQVIEVVNRLYQTGLKKVALVVKQQ